MLCKFRVLLIYIVAFLNANEYSTAQINSLSLYKSTFLGSNNTNLLIYDMVTDAQGYVYMCGHATGNFATVGAYKTTPKTSAAIGVVCKVSPDLSTLVWATYLGGTMNTQDDIALSLAVNSQGEVYVSGYTTDTTFVFTDASDTYTLVNASQRAGIFVAKLNSTGSQLLYSRLIGYSGFTGYRGIYYDEQYSICLNPNNDAFILCNATPIGTNAGIMRVTSNAYQPTKGGGYELGFTKISDNGTIQYCTYVGGSGAEGIGSCFYKDGKVYITGLTKSANFPLASNRTPDAAGDCFIMSWNDGATPTPSSTFIFGGNGEDWCNYIAWNQVSNSFVVDGYTYSTNFPYTNVLQNGQTTGGFVASISPDLTSITNCTMLGTGMRPFSLLTKTNGEIYCCNTLVSAAATAPITIGAYKSTNTGIDDRAIIGLSPSGQLLYGTFVNYCQGGLGGRIKALLSIKEVNSCTQRFIGAVNPSSNTLYQTTSGVYQQTYPGGFPSAVYILQTSHLDTTKITATPTCGEYMFQGTSTGVAPCNAVNYFYNFGDGTAIVTGQQNVTHKYSKNGTFTVTYRVAYQGDTTYYEKTINVQSQPTIKASPNVMYYCTKQNGIQLSASGGVRYEWSPGAVFSDSTKQNPVAKPTKNMWLYVRGYDANGCFATDSVQVYVTSVTATASSDTIVCKGTSVTLNASGGAEVKWSPATGLNKPTGKSVIATPTETTTYQVIVGDGDCKDTTHVTISISNKPKVTLNPAPVICTGGNVQLGAALEGSYIDTLASTYLWTPNINLSNPNIKNPVATPTKTTRYKCTVTNKYGCIITDSVEVKVQNNLKIQLSADTSVCAGFGVLLKASGGANYTWYPPDYLDNPNSATPYCTPQKNITYKVITTSGTCIDSATMSISVNPLPTVKAQGETTVCSGQPVQLSVEQAEPNTTYTWRDSAGTSVGTGASITVNPIVETRYYVTAATNNNCTAHDSVQVHISNIINVQALGATTVCTGTPVQLSINTPDATATYEWTTNGNIIGTGTTITVTPTQTSTFIAHGKRGGCEGWDTVTVQVNNAITVTASADTSICIGATATLRVTNAQQTITYTWRDEQNNVIGNTATITVQPTQTTTYNVKGVQSGCEGAGAVRVVVHALPSVSVRDTSICQGQTATVKVLNPDDNNTYTWKDETGTTQSTTQTLTVTPQTTTRYSVTVRNNAGCEASTQATVTIEPKTSVHLFVAPIRDSIQIGDTVRVQVFAQADRDVQLQQLAYDVQTESDVMDIPTSVHSGQWQQLHVQQVITLTPTPTQVYEFIGKALTTQTRVATVSIQNLNTHLNPECTIQTSKETTFITGTACANDILKFKEEMYLINALGQVVQTTPKSPPGSGGEKSIHSGAMTRVEHKVQIEANGLYFIHAKVNGEWITRNVVVQR